LLSLIFMPAALCWWALKIIKTISNGKLVQYFHTHLHEHG